VCLNSGNVKNNSIPKHVKKQHYPLLNNYAVKHMKQSMWAFCNSQNQKIDITTSTCAGEASRESFLQSVVCSVE